MSYLGKKARIKINEVKPSDNGFGVLRMGANDPDVDFSQAADKECVVIGHSGGTDYGDGMYDEELLILQFEVEGKKKALRVPIHLVEIVE